MNKRENDILNFLFAEPFINQRILAEISGYSLGMVNKSIKSLINKGYLDENIRLTESAKAKIKKCTPKNAVILAAGYGMRMVPINMEIPKGLLEINGEALIERLINQFHEAGVTEIYVVVGFMKEKYEYLIDKYNVELVVNHDYAAKNNIYSLKRVLDKLGNSYIVPCDIWCSRNPFRTHELYSWYMVSDLVDDRSSVRINRKLELVSVNGGVGGNSMIGIAYLLEPEAEKVRGKITELCVDPANNGLFWESALYDNGRMVVAARVVHASNVVEINTYEQLRELDEDSSHLKSDALDTIADVFHITVDDISDITVLKKGMTNRSFVFSCKGGKYIMRIPGEGTEHLINRVKEAEIYKVIQGRGICDDVVFINPVNGYKITKHLKNARSCDANNVKDLECCMKKLKEFHKMKLSVNHRFDIFGQIEFYEGLWGGASSVYRDYELTKTNVLSLKGFIDRQEKTICLTHIDAVPDNFLFYTDEEGVERLQLIDWEYAGMQDPHVDLAMFSIYSMYNKSQVDRLVDIYFEGKCDRQTRLKIYAYISVCGLLWSNWCEYKRSLGVEFGEYSLRQYRFAKDYHRIVMDQINNTDGQQG